MSLLPTVLRRLSPAKKTLVRRAVGSVAPRRLRLLGRIYGTDKEWRHHYLGLYERHLRWSSKSELRILEIGIGGGQHPDRGGASLEVWRRYFPKAEVHGLDLYDKNLRRSRIRCHRGDQGDSSFLRRLVNDIGNPDLVIDDGSHHANDTVTSFNTLFPCLTAGGLYVIEDIHTSYLSQYGGGPPGSPGTVAALVKELVDGLNYQFFEEPPASPSYTDIWVESLHIYRKIVFIFKRALT